MLLILSFHFQKEDDKKTVMQVYNYIFFQHKTQYRMYILTRTHKCNTDVFIYSFYVYIYMPRSPSFYCEEDGP